MNGVFREAAMTWLHWLSSLFLIGFSILVMAASRRLGIGSLQDPGPGFMGFLSSVVLLSLSSMVLIRDSLVSRRSKIRTPSLGWSTLQKPAVLTGSLVLYVLVLPLFGYLPATILLLFVMLATYHRAKWYVHLFVALLIVNVSYLIFNKWLGVLLPVGVLRVAW